jgi:Holliday junction DNA helicase RuvA
VIAQLTGTLVDKGLDSVVVDVSGVGYFVHISLTTLSALPALGQQATLLTHLQVREDALTLYGFATADERQAFELCLSVSGIGPKLALAVLSGLGAPALGEAIASGDVGRLTRVPGIGKKTAERLVMELRDKFSRIGNSKGSRSGATGPSQARSPSSRLHDDVTSALANLGYKPVDAERAVAAVIEQLTAEKPAIPPPVEEVLRRALRSLQRD